MYCNSSRISFLCYILWMSIKTEKIDLKAETVIWPTETTQIYLIWIWCWLCFGNSKLNLIETGTCNPSSLWTWTIRIQPRLTLLPISITRENLTFQWIKFMFKTYDFAHFALYYKNSLYASTYSTCVFLFLYIVFFFHAFSQTEKKRHDRNWRILNARWLNLPFVVTSLPQHLWQYININSLVLCKNGLFLFKMAREDTFSVWLAL